MKIAVIGAGAMGCLYGAYLSKHHNVMMIDAVESQVDAIQDAGITIQEADGEHVTFSGLQAALSGACKDKMDLVVVFVKSIYTQQALEQNKAIFQDSTLVMTLQNGAGNDRAIEQYVSKENVIMGTSRHNAVNLGMGRITHPASGETTIGSNYNESNGVEIAGSMMQEAGFEVVTTDDIQRIIWSKLLVNLSVNTFTAITQTPIGYMVKNPHAWDFAKRLIYEAIEVAEADGTYFDRREALEMVKRVCETAGNGYSSMYQDRKNKIKMEIDSINGAIVEQAKQYGVPTPYNTLIVNLIHSIEGAYGLYE